MATLDSLRDSPQISEMSMFKKDVREVQQTIDELITELSQKWRMEVTAVTMQPIWEMGTAHPPMYNIALHWSLR